MKSCFVLLTIAALGKSLFVKNFQTGISEEKKNNYPQGCVPRAKSVSFKSELDGMYALRLDFILIECHGCSHRR